MNEAGHLRKARRLTSRALSRHSSSSYLILASLILFLTGELVSGTFASSWFAINEYQSTTFSTASLSPPTNFIVQPTGSSLDLSWTGGSGVAGLGEQLSVASTTTSDLCNSSTTGFSALSPATTGSYADATARTAGDWYCYEATPDFWAPVSLTSGLSGTVTTLSVTAIPFAVAANDVLVVTQGTNSQKFVASTSASVGATSIPVTSATANFSYTTAATASDTTSWNAWNSTAYSYSNALYGMVPMPSPNPAGLSGLSVVNGGTAGSIDTGDTITLTFNQAITVPAHSYDVCIVSTTVLMLDDSTKTTCGSSARTSDSTLVGTLVATAGTLGKASGTYTATYTTGTTTNSYGTFGTLTIKLTGTAVASSSVTGWKYTPSSSLTSATGAVAACTTTTLCTPTFGSTGF